MIFDKSFSLLYSDTLVPDIFISEYLPSLDGDYLKLYVYCLFLAKHNKLCTPDELSKKLFISLDKIKAGLDHFEALGIMQRNGKKIVFTDLKEIEINKIYRPKPHSTVQEATLSYDRNLKRSQIISAINDKFFQGVMSPSWYSDIDTWFDRYGFDEDVMYALFQHCSDHKGLSKNYIVKVAEHWHSKKIANSFDLDNYYIGYQKLKDIKSKIVKKLNIIRPLTEYDDEYLERWIVDYKFDFDVIEVALKKTAGQTSISFNYIDKMITDWHNAGLTSKQQVLKHMAEMKATSTRKASSPKIVQHINFEQRKYDKDYYESLYANAAVTEGGESNS